MKKNFCDHCLKEIRGVEINELDIVFKLTITK